MPGVTELAAGRASTDPPRFGSVFNDALLPTSWGRGMINWETVKCCLNGKGLPSLPPSQGPAAPCPQCPKEKEGPTWLAGSSSSLLSEDPSAFFSGGAGARGLLLAALELASF